MSAEPRVPSIEYLGRAFGNESQNLSNTFAAERPLCLVHVAETNIFLQTKKCFDLFYFSSWSEKLKQKSKIFANC